MLASVQLQGADLLGRILEAAAARARGVLGERVALQLCDGIELRDELAEVTFEASCVRRANENLTVTVFASGRDDTGRKRMVAAGRFTFSTFVRPSATIAARLKTMDSRTK
jgi:hypothetical protein